MELILELVYIDPSIEMAVKLTLIGKVWGFDPACFKENFSKFQFRIDCDVTIRPG